MVLHKYSNYDNVFFVYPTKIGSFGFWQWSWNLTQGEFCEALSVEHAPTEINFKIILTSQ